MRVCNDCIFTQLFFMCYSYIWIAVCLIVNRLQEYEICKLEF